MQTLERYITDYLNEEIERNRQGEGIISIRWTQDAIEAYKSGANNDGKLYRIEIKEVKNVLSIQNTIQKPT